MNTKKLKKNQDINKTKKFKKNFKYYYNKKNKNK